MKVYITSRFKGSAENKAAIEQLCSAVRDAGMEDFHFIRDVEHYEPHFFATQQEVWAAAKKTLKECDALLIDISDSPSGGRIVEAGMAFALSKPVYVVMKKGTVYKDFYDGIATGILEYDNVRDIAVWLKPRRRAHLVSP